MFFFFIGWYNCAKNIFPPGIKNMSFLFIKIVKCSRIKQVDQQSPVTNLFVVQTHSPNNWIPHTLIYNFCSSLYPLIFLIMHAFLIITVMAYSFLYKLECKLHKHVKFCLYFWVMQPMYNIRYIIRILLQSHSR